MGKLDALRVRGGANILASASPPAPGSLPVGMTPSSASRMPEKLKGLRKAADTALIPTDRIERDPSQPREAFDPESLGRLADSLRTKGQLQPIRVRWDEGQGVYVVVCGERRWRAARIAGLPELTCVIHQGEVTPEELLSLQVIENALREDLTPIEQARSYLHLMRAGGLTMREVAAELHVSPATVSKAVALLSLPEAVQGQVGRGELAPHTAYEIARSEPADRETLAERAVAGKLTRDGIRAARGPRRRASRTFETPSGPRVTVAWAGDLDAAAVRKALHEASILIESESGG